ncbi:MAG: glycosyltransferase family 2 protein, partial [Candidatus Aenigmatarchaeota archaeon]
DKMKKVSIIMVNYNGEMYLGKKELLEAVESFLETDYPELEFIFVDNASCDNSVESVEKLFRKHPNINTKIVRNKENLGFAGGCNVGISYATGEYICLVNNDDRALRSDWLTKLVEIIEKDKTIGAVFGKKLKWDNLNEVDARGMTINPAGIVVGATDLNDDKPDICLIWQTPVLFRKNLINEIGGKFFDDDYVILHDDTDSSLRIWLAGYKIVYVPKSVVLHKRSATMKKLPVEFVAFHGRKNIIQTIIKCYEMKNLIRWLPITLVVYFASVFYYFMIRRFDQTKATMKAILWNFFNLKILIRKRNYIQKNVRRVSDESIIKLMKPFKWSKILKGEKVWPR